jgi:hypothetical protein
VFDAKQDFGAKADGRSDDTDAIQRAIDAARQHGSDCIAYLPTGTYIVSRTLDISGSNYRVGGTGFRSSLRWGGAEGGTMVHVHDVDHVVLEHLAIGNHDSGPMNNGIDILHTPSAARARMTYDGVFVYGMYQRAPDRKGLHLRGLGRMDTVVLEHVQGNLRITDCIEATILGNCTFEGTVTVEGKHSPDPGFLGFMTRLATIVTHGLRLRDNQSIVMSDFYVEQSVDGCVFEGAGTGRGLAVIQGAKVHFFGDKEKKREGSAFDIRNYAGGIFFGPNQFYVEPTKVHVRHTGSDPVDLAIWGSSFYRTVLDPELGPAATLYLLGNRGINVGAKDQELSYENRAADNVPEEKLVRFAEALDALRQLGEVDLKLNHSRPEP